MKSNIEVYWSGYDKEEAIHALNTEHPEKMMLKMNDGLFIIVKPDDFKNKLDTSK